MLVYSAAGCLCAFQYQFLLPRPHPLLTEVDRAGVVLYIIRTAAKKPIRALTTCTTPLHLMETRAIWSFASSNFVLCGAV